MQQLIQQHPWKEVLTSLKSAIVLVQQSSTEFMIERKKEKQDVSSPNIVGCKWLEQMFSNLCPFSQMLFTVTNLELYSIIIYYFWSTIKLLDHKSPAPRTVTVLHLPLRVGFCKHLTNETAALYKSLPRHPLHDSGMWVHK